MENNRETLAWLEGRFELRRAADAYTASGEHVRYVDRHGKPVPDSVTDDAFIEDVLTAVYGEPKPDPDAARAIYAALNDCDPLEDREHIDAAFAGKVGGAVIDADQARLAAAAAALKVASETDAAASEAGEVKLPADWKYWLIDGARILRSNGTTMHADQMDALAAALTTQGGAEG